jgi:tetrachlorobenzoquinone reductase
MNVGKGTLIDVRVSEIRRAARDINLYWLEPIELEPIEQVMRSPASAGAHVDLHLANGFVRQYSLVLERDRGVAYVVAVKRDQASRGGSEFIHREFRVGTMLQISGPQNHFPLKENAPHTVLIAGGIGITPIYSMARRLVELNRSWELHYACRSRADMAFIEEFSSMPEVHPHFDDESDGAFLDIDGILKGARPDAHFYCCGPMPLMESFEKAAAGVPAEQRHVEYFTPKDAPSRQGSFTVRLAKSEKTLSIPEGQSILDVVLAAGIAVEHSCTEGICGTCETKVLAGTPDHRDSLLTAAERAANKTMMICCSGSLSDELVLDL